MSEHSQTIFTVRNVEVVYKAEFNPPILELVLPQTQINLINHLCSEYKAKFGDFVFNNQAIGSKLINFRRTFPFPNAYFDFMIGVDELQTTCLNPETQDKAWEHTLNLMDYINKLIALRFEKQTLSFNIHCSPDNIIYSNFINKINMFSLKNENIISRGATFSLQSPWSGSRIYIIFDKSMIIDEGLFILMQVFFDESMQNYKDLFSNVVYYLINNIEPLFNIKINYVGRG